MKVKVIAHTFGSSLVETFDTWNDAKRWMEMTDKGNVPHEYNGEIYTIKFEVETLPDMEIDEDEFDKLDELVGHDEAWDVLPVEDVEEAVAEEVAKEVE